ncbi:MAG: LuxR C-terminal-related transcriptional regulator [Aquihabitans sp.]
MADEQVVDLCSRPRLLDAMDDGLSAHRLVLIHAVSGAGKSVLLDQWITRRHLQQPDETIIRLDRHRAADVETLIQGLAVDGPAVLVVDDADHLDPSVLARLDQLLADGPTGLRMVLAGRTRPALSLARLGLDGHVAHLGTEDLALNIAELTDLVSRLTGAPTNPDLCLQLLHETEGWLAGVKLVASGSLTADDAESPHLDNLGNLRAVTDYFVEQVLDPLPADLRQFVSATSVIDRLESGACDAVTGSADGQRGLEELERLGLFLVPLDDRRGSYRHHRMFAAVVRHRFRTDDPEGYEAAQLRAARWYLDVGRPHRGISLLVEAGAWAAVVQEVTSRQFDLVAVGLGRAAVGWLSAVPKDVLDEDPRAAMVLAILHRLNGDLALAEAVFVQASHDAHDGRLDHDLFERMAAGWDASGLAWGTPPAVALEASMSADALLSSTEGALQRSGNLPKFRQQRTQLVWYRSVASEALLHLGRLSEAKTWAARAIEAAGLDPSLRAAALGNQAYIDARSGNLVDAAAAAEESHVLNGGAGSYGVAIDPEFALIEVAYATDDLDRADLLLAGVEERARSMRTATRVAQVALVRAAVALGRGAFRDGLAVLAEHRREGWPALPDGLEVRFNVLSACLRIFTGDVAGGRRELRTSGLALTRAPGAFLTLAAVERDRDAMRIIVDSWPDAPELRPRAQYLVARALLADIEREWDDLRLHVEALASLVVPERFIRPVVDLAPSVAPMIAKVAAEGASADLVVLGDLVMAATRADTRRPATRLSPRELTAIELLATDLTNPEIAETLEVSPNTLKTHLRRAYQKLGVTSRRDAVRRAGDLGLLSHPRWDR